ncbi:hypothetical protein GOP47_0007549 [Adiantum capillus-veneris]|nr:hypothetical protein GOP47_0007549 [Adiantum capillus-veneris]
MLIIAAAEARPLYRKTRRPRVRPWNLLPWNILGQNVGADVTGLEYYVQVGIGQPDLQELIPAINTTYSNNFGSTQLFAFNVTEGADPSSTLLGYVRGYTVESSYTSTGVAVEVEILSYNDGTLNGTVSIQALITNGPNEVSIVGGTGDFRGVSGYGLVNFVNTSGNIVLFHHELHFL